MLDPARRWRSSKAGLPHETQDIGVPALTTFGLGTLVDCADAEPEDALRSFHSAACTESVTQSRDQASSSPPSRVVVACATAPLACAAGSSSRAFNYEIEVAVVVCGVEAKRH